MNDKNINKHVRNASYWFICLSITEFPISTSITVHYELD